MDPITAAAVTGAVGGIGESLISGIGQYAANRSNRRAADRQMAWSERMSSTAYQRAVQDMQKAGINPLYWLKGGASTPGGAMSRSESVTEGIRGTTAKALEARMVASQVKNLEAQNAQIMSQTAVNIATAKEIEARTRKVGAETKQSEFVGTLAQDAEKFLQGAKSTASKFGSSLGHKLYDMLNPNSVPQNMRKKK